MSQEAVGSLSRRNFMKLAGAAGAGLLLEACGRGGQPTKKLPAASPSIASHTPAHAAPTPESSHGKLTHWEQDFSKLPNGTIDPAFWNFETGTQRPSYNKEAETYTSRRQNVRIENGLLLIEARKEMFDGRRYTSGCIDTQGKFGFQTGRLEIVAKLPDGVGTWPAAWLLPSNPGAQWPQDGEIDIFESIGAEPGKLYTNVHTAATESGKVNNQGVAIVPNLANDFNTYGLEMTPTGITFSLNGQLSHSIEKASQPDWPFDQEYYLILNVAMGGTWGGELRNQYPPDGIAGQGPWQMAVQSIRYEALS